jgi:hypothetical protein
MHFSLGKTLYDGANPDRTERVRVR